MINEGIISCQTCWSFGDSRAKLLFVQAWFISSAHNASPLLEISHRVLATGLYNLYALICIHDLMTSYLICYYCSILAGVPSNNLHTLFIHSWSHGNFETNPLFTPWDEFKILRTLPTWITLLSSDNWSFNQDWLIDFFF